MNHSDKFIKVENTRKYKIKVIQLNNTTAELKNLWEGFKNRLGKKNLVNSKDKAVKLNQSTKKKKKKKK